MRNKLIAKLPIYGLLMAVSFVFSLPLLMMVGGSLKSREQLVRDPHQILPDAWHWSNFPSALDSMPFLTYLSNTLLLCCGCVIGTTLSCALVAYGLARIRWGSGLDVRVGRRYHVAPLAHHDDSSLCLASRAGALQFLLGDYWPDVFGGCVFYFSAATILFDDSGTAA